MTTGGRSRWLTRRALCKQSVRISVRGLEPTSGRGRLHGQVPLKQIFRDVLTGQRISDLEKVDGNGESLETPKTQATPDPETPDPETPDEQAPPPARRGLSRRRVLSALGIGAGALIAEQALVADGIPPTTAPPAEARSAPPDPGGYAPDGTAGRAAAVPLDAVELLDGPFRQNQARNTTYLLFLDPER